jgi:hypothetical protein
VDLLLLPFTWGYRSLTFYAFRAQPEPGRDIQAGGDGGDSGGEDEASGGIGKKIKNVSNAFKKGGRKAGFKALKGMGKGLIKGAARIAGPAAIAQTGKGLYDFFADKKLRDTGIGGFMESLGGTGAGILDSLTFGLSKSLFNATGVSIPGMDTDDVASARAIFHKSGRDPDNSRSPMSLDNKQLIQDILANPDAYPEGIVEQAKGVNIEELKLGGLVTKSGLAQVDAGEVYLGGNSLGVLKNMLDALQEQNNHLKALLNKNQNIYLDSTKVGTAFSLNT